MSYDLEDFAERLREARNAKHLSQRELSKLAGVPQAHISRIESKQVDLRLSSLIAIANALDLEVTLVPRQALPAVQPFFSNLLPGGICGNIWPAWRECIRNHLGGKAFIIERFDRTDDGQRIHTEDFAQVFGVYPHAKYEKASYRSLARVIAAESGDEDIAELIRRATFNVLIGNGDMHLKNWSLIYRDRQRAELAPAYDFVSTIASIPNDKSALNFSRSKAFADYTVDELQHLAAKAALPRKRVLDVARETVALFMQRWASEKHHLPMSADIRFAIDRHLATLPIAAA